MLVLSPLYRTVRRALAERDARLGSLRTTRTVAFGGKSHRVDFLPLALPTGVQVCFLDCPALYDREGIYGGVEGEFADNAERFSVLCRASLDAASELMGAMPDVFHCHDWPTGLLPLMLREQEGEKATRPHSIFTVHNLAFLGCFPKGLMSDAGLPWSSFTSHGLEFYDQVSMLKAGIAFADVTTTVSVSYADEIRTPEFGCHLDGFLRHDCPRLIGIRNGIDVDAWDPNRDAHLAAPYTSEHLAGKAICREALLAESGWPPACKDLLIGVVSRLANQKGLDLVAELVPELHELGARLVLVGDGDANLEERFAWLARTFRDNLSITLGFDVALSHRVFAGADAFLMPSRFEPCGLGQMVAMRYGTIPVVHAVGGLRDTVQDPEEGPMLAEGGNGFAFESADVASLRVAVRRAAQMHRERPAEWSQLMHRGMSADWSWSESARAYLDLYFDVQAS